MISGQATTEMVKRVKDDKGNLSAEAKSWLKDLYGNDVDDDLERAVVEALDAIASPSHESRPST